MNELKKFSDIEVKYENSPFRILHITLHCIDIHDNSQIKYIKYQFTTPPVSCRIKYITYTVRYSISPSELYTVPVYVLKTNKLCS